MTPTHPFWRGVLFMLIAWLVGMAVFIGAIWAVETLVATYAHGALPFHRRVPPPASHKWTDNLQHEMESRGVPWDLAYRICNRESSMTLHDNSPGAHGEWGPCQMMPRTASAYINNTRYKYRLWYIRDALVHPVHGPRIAAQHMAFLYERYTHEIEAVRWVLVAAAWNAGQDTGDYAHEIGEG